VLNAGESFGDMALFNNRLRLATIKAIEPTHTAILRKG